MSLVVAVEHDLEEREKGPVWGQTVWVQAVRNGPNPNRDGRPFCLGRASCERSYLTKEVSSPSRHFE